VDVNRRGAKQPVGGGPEAFALADDRTAELADWKADVVQRQIKELAAEFENFDAGEIGFDLRELDALLKGDIETAHGFTPPKPMEEPPTKPDFTRPWILVINCQSEQQHAELIEEMERRGIECTAPSMYPRLFRGLRGFC
jgi:hypothetical protein